MATLNDDEKAVEELLKVYNKNIVPFLKEYQKQTAPLVKMFSQFNQMMKKYQPQLKLLQTYRCHYLY